MEFLRKSWKWILGFIGFFIGLVWMMNSHTDKKVKKLKKNIKSNKKKTKEVDKKIENVKKKKKVTKKKIADTDTIKSEKKGPVIRAIGRNKIIFDIIFNDLSILKSYQLIFKQF